MDTLVETLTSLFDQAHTFLFVQAVQPLVFGLGFGHLLEDAHEGSAWVLMGAVQLAVMVVVFRALERWRPVEVVVDRAAVRDDIVYTLVHRLGVFRLAMFLTLAPVADAVAGELRLLGFKPWQLDAWWPGFSDKAWVSFLIYLVAFDFIDYGIHRLQHGVQAWWQLHALHHSQRQMTMWSDNRNHLLDDVLRDAILVTVALVLGVEPGQFMAIVAVTMLVESLSHANTRLSFGPWLSRCVVGPAFHRHHHAIGVGHESAGVGSLGGHNFAVLFPVWDVVFKTAQFDTLPAPTGTRDQLPEHGGRDYGRGFWRQQWLGVLRLVGRA